MFDDILSWGATPGRPNAVKDGEIEMLAPQELAEAFLDSILETEEALLGEVAAEADLDLGTSEELVAMAKQVGARLILDEKLVGGRHRENGHIYLREAADVNMAAAVLEALFEIGGGELPPIEGLFG